MQGLGGEADWFTLILFISGNIQDFYFFFKFVRSGNKGYFNETYFCDAIVFCVVTFDDFTEFKAAFTPF